MCGSREVCLYAMQAQKVLDVIERDGVCYSRAEYVRRKYAESAPIFLTAYGWFVREAEKIVPRPENAEYPYWAFRDLYSVDGSGGGCLLKLRVPDNEAVFFDVHDWNKILRLSYIGQDEEDEQAFAWELEQRGLNTNQIMLTSFYPEWKEKITDSWKRLFRHHEAILAGDTSGVHSVQASLWRIKKEWICPDHEHGLAGGNPI